AGLAGGKALNLGRLQQSGAPVPDWYAVTTEAFQCATESIRNEILDELKPLVEHRKEGRDFELRELEKISQSIRKKIVNLDMPAVLLQALQTELPNRIGKNQYFSVRSSAVDEDAGGASFAGLHDSYLFVRGFDSLLEKIRRVWASAFNTRALMFRLQNGIPIERIAIAVIVQKMVAAERSGIVFTANPNTGNVHELLVSALYGAGEGIVSAGLDADLYTVSKNDLSYREVLASKSEQLLLDRETGSGLIRRAVPEAIRHRSTLTGEEIRNISRLSLAIERHFGKPQDIEFSIDAERKIWILQSRPITTVDEYGPAAGNRLIWDNSNIIESYSGVTLPLTFSFIRQAYAAVYRGFAEIMGVDAGTLRLHRHVFENMLGFFRGRVYYNIMNWYRIIGLFPGFRYNKVFLESMLGMKYSMEYAPPRPVSARGQVYRLFWEPLLMIRVAGQTLYNFNRLEKLVTDFETNFEFHFSRWKQIDFNRRQPNELMNLYRDMEESLLLKWKTPTINDFFVMIYYGLLKRLCLDWCQDKEGTLQNDLICGEGDIVSTAPARMAIDIARKISENSDWRSLFENSSPAELASRV
ncbi:MAG TPA: PEP/pyruvate-binding domain-containing protein, partial [Methylomicrobium sp.]|nr:PEP/pyruvate-binding domain-containing protein [Methylomicrobium sp.]